jgi:hypothetical protein
MKVKTRRRIVRGLLAAVVATMGIAMGPSSEHALAVPIDQPDNVYQHSAEAPKAAVTYVSEPHVFYYDKKGHNLRRTWREGGIWRHEAVDGHTTERGATRNDVGQGVSAVVAGTQMHVFYRDATGDALRHAWKDSPSSLWNYDVIAEKLTGEPAWWQGSVGFGWTELATSTAALNVNGRAFVYWTAKIGGRSNLIQSSWWSTWTSNRIDGSDVSLPGIAGETTNDVGSSATAVMYQGEPHVFYRDDTSGDLRHAWGNPYTNLWIETLDGDGVGLHSTSDVAQHSAAVLIGGTPHVFYSDHTDQNLRHAWWNGARWGYEHLDGNKNDAATGRRAGNIGYYPSAIGGSTRAEVFYVGHADGVWGVRHARWNGSQWSYRTAVGEPNIYAIGATASTYASGWIHNFHSFGINLGYYDVPA